MLKTYAQLRRQRFEEAAAEQGRKGQLPLCEREGCDNVALDWHHKGGRRGAKLLDVEASELLCRPCHHRAHGQL